MVDFGSELLKQLIIMISCFAICEISFQFRKNFAKRENDNFAKRENDNFAIFSRKHENKNLRSHPNIGTRFLIPLLKTNEKNNTWAP